MLERIRFIKVNSNKRFDYAPRYYDERKEKLEALKKSYEANNLNSEEDMTAASKERMRVRMQDSFRAQKDYQSKSNSQNIRLILILAALIIVIYFVFQGVDDMAGEVINIDQ